MSNGSGLFRRQAAQKPHLLRGSGGVAAEVGDLRSDVLEETSPLSAFTVDEFTNLPTADVDAFLLAKATSVAAQQYLVAALDGVVGDDALAQPRDVTVTTVGADANFVDTSTVTVTGKDINDDSISEVFTILLASSPGTFVGVKAFKKITQIDIQAQAGVGGTISVGFGSKIGLSKKLKARAGLSTLLMEIEVGVKVTTGTLAAAAVGLPNGTYLPAIVPDGVRDYAVYYEYDPQA